MFACSGKQLQHPEPKQITDNIYDDEENGLLPLRKTT